MKKEINLLDEKINELFGKTDRVVVTIDGNSCAGKSTLAEELKCKYNCNIFHMDDFFLQPFQRTQERLSEAGGNIDYERFIKEVLLPLQAGKSFTYRVYDCSKGEMGEEVEVNFTLHTSHSTLSIVEGVYSIHPKFADFYNLKIFLKISENQQKHRLMKRDSGLYNRFINEWIPMENKYFEAFKISDKCDFVFEL